MLEKIVEYIVPRLFPYSLRIEGTKRTEKVCINISIHEVYVFPWDVLRKAKMYARFLHKDAEDDPQHL
ncbi:MAG: hypothetical protein ABIJ21_03435 [Nanoarchaeota archaeon]